MYGLRHYSRLLSINFIKVTGDTDTTTVSLASSNARLAHFKLKEQHVVGPELHVVGEDFSVSGPNDGNFCPDTYFGVEVLTRGLVAIKMVWEWRDQVESLFFP